VGVTAKRASLGDRATTNSWGGGDIHPFPNDIEVKGEDMDWTEYEGIIAYNIRGVGVNENEVADVVQDTFVRLIDGDSDPENPKAFVSQVARRAAIDHIRKRQNRLDQERDHSRDSSVKQYYSSPDSQGNTGEMVVVSKGASPETQAIEKDLINKSLASLTEEQRQAVYLIDVMGYTYQEGADLVGISKQSFHRRHTRARAGLKRWRAQCGG
jgi:RNA polymerase sigma-70 factor (ECF subfamily)